MTITTRIEFSRDSAIALALGCATALQTVRSPSFVFYLPQLAVIIGALVYGDLFKALRGSVRHFYWFFAFALLCLLSVVWSDFPNLVAKTWRENFLVPGLFFLSICGIIRRTTSDSGPQKFLIGLVVTFVAASLISWISDGTEAMRRFDTVGYYSTYVITFAAAVTPFLTSRVRVAFYVLTAIGLWWCQQRVSWVMFPFIAMLDWTLNFRCRITVKGLFMMLAAATFSYLMMKSMAAIKPPNAFDASVKTTGLLDYLLANERVSRWHEWAVRAMANPVWGLGYGRENALAHFSGGNPWPESNLYHAHNIFLNHFVQLGLVGFSLFIAAHVQLLIFFWRRFANMAARAGFFVVLCFLARNLFDDFSYGRLLVVYGGVLGVMVGSLMRSERFLAAKWESQRLEIHSDHSAR